MSLGARFSIRSVILSKSLADAFSEIHGLHRMLMVITSPAIRSKHRNSGGIGEYTRSFPQFGHRITKNTGWWKELLFGSNENICACGILGSLEVLLVSCCHVVSLLIMLTRTPECGYLS